MRIFFATAIRNYRDFATYFTPLLEETSLDGNEIDILQLKTRDYNRKLQEEKENVNLWLEFVDFQDEVFKDQVEKAENGKNISQGS